jgi:putative flippase GtrA
MGLAARSVNTAPRHLRILDSVADPMTDGGRHSVDVEIVVPVYNEAAQLAQRIQTLRTFLDDSFPFTSLVTIVDNGSDDGTAIVAAQLAAALPGVAAMSLSRKGRGFALRTAWSSSTARVVAYMDVDLSTSLSALLPLVAPLLSGHGQVSIGTRLARGSRVVRGPKRELISRAYNLLLRVFLHTRVSDAQCGFKAVDRHAALELLPLIEDEEWFFDTELLVTAERLGLRVSEVAVDWVDDPDSRVHIVSTALSDLRGIWRMSCRRARAKARTTPHHPETQLEQVTADQLFSFAGVGVLSTLSYLFLFASSRDALGVFAANAAALAACTLVNTSIHRTLAQRMHGSMPGRADRPRFVGTVTGLFAISAVLTSTALIVAGIVAGNSLTADLVGVSVANAIAAVLRFAVLRAWVFRPQDSGTVAAAGAFR